MTKKTLDDLIEIDPKNLPFNERAAQFEKELAPIVNKLGVMPWAGIHQTEESLTAVPMLRDLWEQPQA